MRRLAVVGVCDDAMCVVGLKFQWKFKKASTTSKLTVSKNAHTKRKQILFSVRLTVRVPVVHVLTIAARV